MAYYLPRLQSLPNRITAHMKVPDVNKLVRALTGLAFHDDRQIVQLPASKHYAGVSVVPHLDIKVEPVEEMRPAMSLFSGAENDTMISAR